VVAVPRSKDPLLRLLAKHHTLDEWERYTGPQGGEGWINTVTGEKVYQEEKPGSESSDGAESETYETAKSIIEASYDSISGTTFEPDAIREAVVKTNPEDTADALFDALETHYEDDSEGAYKRAKHLLSEASADTLSDVRVTVALDDGEEVTFSQRWGEKINVDKREQAVKQILTNKGFTHKEYVAYHKLLKNQKRGPKVAGDDRMDTFNAVATVDAGASGHTAKYRPFRRELDTLRAVREPMLKALRKMHGDTITLYRGEEDFDNEGEYRETRDGKSYIEFDSHQPAESWSMRPMLADNFGDFILKEEVPIERVVAANFVGAGYDKEAEMLVAMDRKQLWGYGDKLFFTGPEADDFEDNETLSKKELAVGELRFIKQQLSNNIQQNVETGEVTYGEKPGDVDESQEQQTLPGAKIDTSQRFTRDDVWNSPVAISNIIREVSGNEDLDSLPEFYQWVQEEGTEADIREVHDRLATGPTPYDVTDDDVPDAKFNPNNYEEFGGLSDMLGGDMHGVNAGNMYIAKDGGKRLFITNLNREISAYPEGGAMSPESLYFDREVKADNAYVASKLMGIMQETAPEHHLQKNEFLAVEEYDGVPLSPVMSTMRKIRIQDTLFAYGAHLGANAVIGNNDPHGKNVFLGYDGYATVDLDQAFSLKYPSVVIDNVTRKMSLQMEELFGYQPTEEEEEMIQNTAEAMTNAMSLKARYIDKWLNTGEEKNGISPDDLSKRQRHRLNKYIEYIRSGKHKDKIKERLE